MSESHNFIRGHDIGGAWLRALDRVTMGDVPNRYLTIHVDDPLTATDIPDTTDLDDWADVINVGDVYDEYCAFDFEDESKIQGTTGRAWIESRIYEMYDGLYDERLSDPDQIEMITERLKEGNHGSCTNALVAQVYDTEADLEVATSGRPFAKDMACMTQIQFRPKKDQLHVFATFRSQYMDAKAYGNMIALAMLLGQVCDETGYDPGVLVEHANNTIAYSKSASRRLLAQPGAPSTTLTISNPACACALVVCFSNVNRNMYNMHVRRYAMAVMNIPHEGLSGEGAILAGIFAGLIGFWLGPGSRIAKSFLVFGLVFLGVGLYRIANR